MVAIEVSVQTDHFESSLSHRADLMFNSDILDVEDCRFLLRALEKEAFSTVICALRAQGPLSQYKEVLIDHLRAVFFISDDEAITKMRMASNDPLLTQIAENLNPSYDITTEWAAASYSNVPYDIPEIPQDKSRPSLLTKKTNKLHEMMNSHNKKIEDENEALLRLINLPKKVYVPEKLRKLLQESEKDANGHLEVVKEKKAKEEKSSRNVGRPRKNTVTSPMKEKVKHRKSVEIQTSPAKEAKSPKKIELPIDEKKELILQSIESSIKMMDVAHAPGISTGVFSPELLIPKISAREDISQAGIHMSLAEAKSVERRKRKEKANDATCICARVQPFVFERPAPGSKHKPPRGNPDKRTAKRSNSQVLPYGQPVIFDSTSDPSAGPSTMNNSADRPHILSNYGLPVPPKKIKALPNNEIQTPSLPANAYVAGLMPPQQMQKSPRPTTAGIRIAGNPSYVANVAPLCSNPTRPYYGNPLVAARAINPLESQAPSTSGLHFTSPNIVLAQPPGDGSQLASKDSKPINLSADSNARPSPIYSITSLIPSNSQQLAMDILQKHVNAAKQDLNHNARGPAIGVPKTTASQESMAANIFLDHDYRTPQQANKQVHEYIVRASAPGTLRKVENSETPKQVVNIPASTSIVTQNQPPPQSTPQRVQQKANGPAPSDLSFMKGSSGLEFLASTASILATLQSSRQAILQQQQQQQNSNGPTAKHPPAPEPPTSVHLPPTFPAIRTQQPTSLKLMENQSQAGASTSSHFAPSTIPLLTKASPMSTSGLSAAVLDLKALAGLRADEQPTLGSLLADPHTRKLLVSTPNVFQNLDQRLPLVPTTESSTTPSTNTKDVK